MTLELDQLPSSPDVECLTLGGMINDPEGIDATIAAMTPQDFHQERHKLIFAKMKELREAGQPVDSVTLFQSLMRDRLAEAAGGLSYLVSLDVDLPKLVNIEAYIGILREKAIARQIIILANELQTRALAGEDAVSLLDAVRSLGDRLMLKNGQSFEICADIIERIGINEFFQPLSIPGIEPPLTAIGELFRFTPKSQTILAGPTGGGKTALALQCAVEAAMRNYRTAIYSFEMPNEENLRRIIAQIAQVNMHRLRSGGGSAEELRAAGTALQRIDQLSDLIMFRDIPLDVGAINSDMQNLRVRGKLPALVIVDHLHIMPSAETYDNRAQQISALSRGLKNTWTRFSNAGLVLAQFSRKGDECDEPELSWLKESGSIEQDADHVLFLWGRTHGDRDQDVRDWCGKVAKNRQGPTGRFSLSFFKKYTYFAQVGGANGG